MDLLDKHRDRMARGRLQRERQAQKRAASVGGGDGNACHVAEPVDELELLRSTWSTGGFAFQDSSSRARPRPREHTSMYDSFLFDAPCFEMPPSLSSWGGSSAVSLPSPAHFAALDPSKHSLETPDAFKLSDRFGKRANPSLRPRQELELWSGDGGGGRRDRGGSGEGRSRKQPAQAEADQRLWESWESKWARLLEAEEALERAEAERRGVAQQRLEEETRKAAQAERVSAAARAAELDAKRRESEQWRRRQQDGHQQFEQQRARWRQQDEEQRQKQAQPQWWETGGQRARSASKASATPTAAAAVAPVPARRECQFGSWSEYSAAWDIFEEKLAKGSTKIAFADIPWPNLPGGSVAGITAGMAAADIKKRLFGALRRWHPDKWQSVLERVVGADLDAVKRRIKEVTEEILREKSRASV